MIDNIEKLNEDLKKVVNERPPATDPWSRAVPEQTTHDPAAEHEDREAARAAQRDEHNERVAHSS